ncbi:hypothetical protein MMC19_002761 [Ptychographa xylographoides]|nr:hypothetical protein [Ptychographa xylographoides]
MSDGSTFRLVSIWPGTGEQRIECDFLEVPTGATPKYSALSYAWGDPTATALVWNHGRAIGIASNLDHALRRLRDPVQIRTFWIDALCINQQDEAGEKATQIPLMRLIYKQAVLVSIYLGNARDGSEMVPSLCERINRAYERSQINSEESPWIQQAINTDDYQKLGLPAINSGLWDILRSLLCRAWFTRIWVIQEAVLSTSTEVICGMWIMKWTDLLRALIRAVALGLGGIVPDHWEAGASIDSPANPAVAITLIIFMNALGAGTADAMYWKCIDLFHRGRYAFATNPKDYCYGMLGLSKELGDPDLRVDYSLSVGAIYRQFARHFVVHGDGIKMLYNASGHNLDLPSWIPDWSHRNVSLPRIVPQPPTNAIAGPSWTAATASASSIRLHPNKLDILIVRGVTFDRIEILGSSHSLVDLTARERLGAEPSIMFIADCITEMCHLLRIEQGRQYPTGELYDAVIWKTLICNLARGSMKQAPLRYATFYKALLLLIVAHNPSWPAAITLYPNLPGKAPLVQELAKELAEDLPINRASDTATMGNVIIQGARELCYRKRRGRTRRGYVGQFSLHSLVGDMVFLPLGSAVPFLIRERPESAGATYELIGECYVHGIMKGEVLGMAAHAAADIHLC